MFGWLIDWLIFRLVECSFGWLIDWLIIPMGMPLDANATTVNSEKSGRRYLSFSYSVGHGNWEMICSAVSTRPLRRALFSLSTTATKPSNSPRWPLGSLKWKKILKILPCYSQNEIMVLILCIPVRFDEANITLNDRLFILNPKSRSFLVGIQRASLKALDVILQHLLRRKKRSQRENELMWAWRCDAKTNLLGAVGRELDRFLQGLRHGRHEWCIIPCGKMRSKDFFLS